MATERESVPDDDFARRVAALYGPDRAAALFARWEKWRAQGREAEAGGDGALPSGLAGAVAAYCQSPLSVAENSSCWTLRRAADCRRFGTLTAAMCAAGRLSST